MKKFIYTVAIALIATACNNSNKFDAQGTFEATEIVVSAEATGKILKFDIEEGTFVNKDCTVGVIDTTQLYLQRKQLIAQQTALLSSRPDIKAQVASLKEQITKQKSELKRFENMLRDGAATQKQYDDIDAQVRILESQLEATLSTLNKNTATINENATALETQIALISDQIEKCYIHSPINGTVLVKYAEPGELVTMGKPLMKVADLENIYIRAYFTSEQLADIKLGDSVTVVADFGNDKRYNYEGKIVWIASECEFTPKNIQTKESRANLVYAVKIAVKNDGRLKIGLAGEVIL